jgi:signal transduction histidine kinase
MPVGIDDILHVLAHELRTPVGIAHGYVRLLLEDRLPHDADRRRALEQLQKAIGRLSRLSDENTALATWYERERSLSDEISVHALVHRVADTTYEWPVTVEPCDLPQGAVVRSVDADTLGSALVDIVRATAREQQQKTCHVVSRVVDGQFEMLAGPADLLDALRDGPTASAAGPITLERGGLGLALVHAAVVLDHHGAQRWTMNSSRRTIGVRLPLAPAKRPRDFLGSAG